MVLVEVAMEFRDESLPLEDRVRALLAELTVDEKLSLCAGRNFWETRPVPRLGLRPFRMTDGPRGVAFHSARVRGTAFPSGIALGASWDPELARRVGEAIGRETREAGCRMVLGPAVNLCRTPLGGRTFEYFTEDPHLNARLAVPYIEGVQSQGTAACIKHYAANNQETNRMRNSSQVSQRALRELYLPVFEAGVREAGSWSVMAAYNGVNGVAACENGELLHDVLRSEWGFDGFVVSDWFAVRRTSSADACLRAGLNLEMPGRGSRYRPAALRKELAAGRIDEAALDRSLRGLLRVMFRTGHIDEPPRRRRRGVSTPEHQALAREAAEAGITLLRNEGGLLPLEPGRIQRVAVLGPKAKQRHCWPLWGGSSGVWPPHEVTPQRGLAEALAGRVELVDSAAEADVAIVCVGQSHWPGLDSEVRDRSTLGLRGHQDELVRRTAAENPNTVVVIVTGSPITMDWADEVPSILLAWYPGMEGGRAIARALLGEINPSGKLPVTFPQRLADSPAHRSPRTFPGSRDEVHYEEDIFVGYRHFDREDIEPLHPFGHGLSYTRFEYADLVLESPRWEGEGSLGVALTLTNVGPCDGAEVVQLYVGDLESRVARPPRELRAFSRRFLRAGESARVELRLSARDLAYFCEERMAWRAEAGHFDIAVGSSSRDLRLHAPLELVKDWGARPGSRG
jgi:beta-glucosidase